MRTIKKRRRQAKTNYAKRIKLLKGDSPRIVFRRTNKQLIAQYIKSKEAQDKIEFSINSKILLKYSWPEKAKGSLKSLPAAYLLGLLFGQKVLEKKEKSPIVDFGMYRTVHKTKLYAFIKGLQDAGLKIKCKEDSFPSQDRLQGKHLKNLPFEQIKSKIQEK